MSQRYKPVPVTQDNFQELIRLLTSGRAAFGDFKFIHKGAIYWGVDNLENLQLFVDTNTGKHVGFAWYDDPLEADYAVMEDAPELHEAAVKWLLTKAKDNPENAGTTERFSITCYESDTYKMAYLLHHGFEKDENHYFLHSIRDLDTLPQPELPDGFSIRPVNGTQELNERAHLHRDVFSTPTRPSRMTPEKYIRFMQLPGYNGNLLVDMVSVAANGDFASFTIVWMDELNKIAYVEPVGTKEEYRRKGLARATIFTALQYAKEQGCTRADVISTSAEARQTYKNLGFVPLQKEFFFKRSLF